MVGFSSHVMNEIRPFTTLPLVYVTVNAIKRKENSAVLHPLSPHAGDKNVDFDVYINITNPPNTTVECFFQPEYTCTIDYGTDSSYTNLVYSDSNSTLNETTTIALSRRIRRGTTYYYIVSAESSSQCVRVRGAFQARKSFVNKLRIRKFTEISSVTLLKLQGIQSSLVIDDCICYY